MKKITIKKINEDIYYEKLDNGLDVYLYVNENIGNNYVTFTTKYGSVYNEFEDNNGKMIKVPNGIAHFLEHKVFAKKDDPQPFDYYAANGTSCNAYTTFKNTTYLFSGINNIYDNVEYLLSFVQDIYLTDDNVESEKGIITQEINMGNDDPDTLLYDKIRLNTIKANPFRESIIGTEKEVRSITKDMLLKCYNRFYHPANMFLVVTGNFDRDKMIDIIIRNQKNKKFSEFKSAKLKKYKESDDVVKEREIIKCNTDIPKMAYSIKIPVNKFNMDNRKLNICMFIIFNLLFGDTSLFDYECKRDGIITNTLYISILDIDTHFIISLINSGDKYEDLIKRIDKKFKDISFNENDLERKKKVLISNEVFSYENVEMVNDMIVDNIVFDNRIEDNIIDIINSISIDEINDIVKKINFDNKSIVILEK